MVYVLLNMTLESPYLSLIIEIARKDAMTLKKVKYSRLGRGTKPNNRISDLEYGRLKNIADLRRYDKK